MKESLLELKNEEKNIAYINNTTYKKRFLSNFFFFKFLHLLKISKQRKIKFEDVKEINHNIDINAIIDSKTDNLYLIKRGNILNFLIEQNKKKIFFIIFLNILRIILIILIFYSFVTQIICFFYK